MTLYFGCFFLASASFLGCPCWKKTRLNLVLVRLSQKPHPPSTELMLLFILDHFNPFVTASLCGTIRLNPPCSVLNYESHCIYLTLKTV